jgi:RecB family exonuclease
MSFERLISDASLGGLRPRTWLSVGPGFAREEVKAHVLQSRGFVSQAIVRVDEIATAVLGVRADRVLGSGSRQEALRILLAEPRILARTPELKRLRRQSGFYRKLDAAIQGGRMAAAHEQELEVYSERLAARLGPNPLREELVTLARAYEAWLGGMELWDPPRLLREATAALDEGRVAAALPAKVIHLCAQTPESLEIEFWGSLAKHVELVRTGPVYEEPPAPDAARFAWERWHTLDDAAERLAETVAREGWQDRVVLIPDVPAVRRSLKRALESRGVPVADPRDPTRLRWEEQVKWAILPLETVARGYERGRVISWLRSHLEQPELPKWVAEINARGIRQGLGSYAGGNLAQVHSFLRELEGRFGGKRLATELSEAHLAHLRAACGDDPGRMWLSGFFEGVWKELISDMGRVGQGSRRAPALYWLERLSTRIDEAPPPPERLKPAKGVLIHRLGQAPLAPCGELTFFGLPGSWLLGDGAGDYWFSEREREILASEFAVRSPVQVHKERKAALHAWMAAAPKVTLLDAQYDWDGRERETLAAALRDLGLELEPREMGAHPRWIASFGAERPLPALEAQLPSALAREIRATDLDHYSRCGFQGLVRARWRLSDVEEPEADLWRNARGNILHRAIRILIETRDEEGRFTVEPARAIDEAWELERPRGLFRGERLARFVKARLLLLVRAFCEKEREFHGKARTRVLSLEGPELRLEYPDFVIKGIPDRVDEHADGLFVLDYKTSSNLPHGRDMVELGYRPQLPFYALAAARHFGKPAVGVQFVELDRSGTRNKGIFFTRLNGKEPGKLTQARANSGSLFDGEADAVWSAVEEKLVAQAREYLGGKFAARPVRGEKECRTCMLADFCGLRRLAPAEGGSEESGE